MLCQIKKLRLGMPRISLPDAFRDTHRDDLESPSYKKQALTKQPGPSAGKNVRQPEILTGFSASLEFADSTMPVSTRRPTTYRNATSAISPTGSNTMLGAP